MANLSHRFDTFTEEHEARQLDRIRTFARESKLPDNLIVEIGSNRARFLASMAEQYQQRFVLGIEFRRKYADLGKERLAQRSLDNAALLQADANLALPVVFDDGQIGDIFIPFPDPWWKRRHRKRRIIQPAFLDLLSEKMRSGGGLWIRTDVGPLADDMRKIIDAHRDFRPLPLEEFPTIPFPRTTREKTILDKGLPVHALYYRRVNRSNS